MTPTTHRRPRAATPVRPLSWRVAATLLALAPLGLCDAAWSQRVTGADRAAQRVAPPPLPADTMARLMDGEMQARIRALVEEVLHRTLAEPPATVVVDPAGMREVIERALRAVRPDGRFEAAQLDQLAQRQIAIYDPVKKIVALGAGGLASVGDSERGPVLRMLYAQALASAVIDRELGLPAFAAGETAEIAMTRRMLSEGLSVTVRDRVAGRLGIDAFARQYRALLPGMFDQGSGPSLERSIYGTGRIVVEALWNGKGIDATWSFLAGKPTSVKELGRVIPRSRAVKSLQAALDRLLPAKDWVRARAPAPPSSMIAGIKGLAAADRNRIAERAVAAETLGFSGRQGESILFTSVRLADAEAADAFEKMLAAMPSALAADFGAKGVRVEVTRTARRGGADPGIEFAVATLTLAQDDPTAKPTVLMSARRGTEVIGVTFSNVVVPDATVQRALDALAESLGAEAELGLEDAPDAPPTGG